MSGLTAQGFQAKTLQEILAEIQADQLAEVAADLDLSPAQPLGQINGIISDKLAEAWELLALAYSAFNESQAEGYLLTALALLTGTKRPPASKSTVTCTLTLAAATTVPAGRVISVTGQPTIRFVLTADVVSTTSGDYPGIFEAEITGPVVANAGTLEVIVTPVSGWTAVTNPLDAAVGRNEATDTELRQRRAEELAAPGSSTTDAIRSDILQIEHTDGSKPVEECRVFENTTLVTDGDGLPGKSFEVVLWDGATPLATNAEIGKVVWESKPSGIESYGVTSANVLDSLGFTRTIRFTRATQRLVWLTYTLTTDNTFDPINGPAALKALVVSRSDALLKQAGGGHVLGADVIALAFRAVALEITGVVDISDFRLGFASSPTGTANLTIASRELARFDTSRIVVA